MKKVLILGAGLVVKPMVDYFLENCKYKVLLADQYLLRAKKIISDKIGGKAVFWKSNQTALLHQMVNEADLVVSMLPPQFHISVAQSCIENKTSLVTTSYISSAMKKLDQQAKALNLIFLNEIGEDPGLDHLDAKRCIDNISAAGGHVISLKSYGAGLPHPGTNSNPFGYKFSWSPRGVFRAARQPAVYFQDGRTVFVSADSLFEHPRKIYIEGIGTFETYPNRDCRRYIIPYQIRDKITFFRGLLRYPGWCEAMQKFKKLNLYDDGATKQFENKSFKEFALSLIENSDLKTALKSGPVQAKVACFLNIKKDHDFIKKTEWLGLYSEKKISRKYGTNLDILLDLMLKKMSYGPDEKDMIIIHNEIVSVLKNQNKKSVSTLLLEGTPSRNGAMAKAVSLPAAIASRMIIENKIKIKGVQLPIHKEIYQPVLDELHEFGIVFKLIEK